MVLPCRFRFSLGSYHKKKYVWKLVYIFVLGYDVDFGHMEAISLMLSTKYSEKVVGYAAVALMVHPTETTDELMATVVNAIRTEKRHIFVSHLHAFSFTHSHRSAQR